MPFVYKVQKGDTLNKVAQKFGFSNFREAGISSVPSGNFDLIREGEEVTLANYDPNNISTIKEGSPVISSKDKEQGFAEDSDKLDQITTDIQDKVATKTDEGSKTDDKTTTDKTEVEPFGTGEDGKTTTDPILDKLNKWEAEQDKKAEVEAEKRKADYRNLFNTSLAAIDATTKATLDRINSTYDKRIEEQKRINRLNIDRVKAYGLAEGGRFVPLMFSDAVTNREEEAADKISGLENQRNSLIREAEAARDKGEAGLLREKMEDLERVETNLRKELERIEKEADDQYKLLRDLRKEAEEKHQQEVKDTIERLKSLAPKYAEEYEGMTEEEKDAFITKLSTQTGVDYATLFGILEGATLTDLDREKKEAEIDAVEALTESRKASAAKTRADALIKDTEKKDESTMRQEIPDDFASDSDFQKKRRDYIKKYGTKGADLWDEIFFNEELEEYVYDTTGSGGDEGGEEDDPLGIL